MVVQENNRAGFQSILAFQDAFSQAEKIFGKGSFDPASADREALEFLAMRTAGVQLDQYGGFDAMMDAACAMVAHDPRRFFGLGVVLSVVWSGVGDWPTRN